MSELERLRRVAQDRKAILERIEEMVASGKPIKRDGPEHVVLLANIIEWEDGAPKAGEEVRQAVEAVMGRADRSGQLVASTPGQKGAGEEKTGAPASPSGHSRAEPFGLGASPERPSRGLAAPYGIIDPDYARVFTIARCLAWQEGYALLMHGSFTRDLDLLAVPWGEMPCEPEHLISRIQEAAGLRSAAAEPIRKPHGRLTWTLLFDVFGDPRFVDIGVIAPGPGPGAGGDLASAIAAEIMGLGWALPDFRGDEEEAEEECDRRHGQVQHAVEAVLARSGKLVASTGSGEETKGAPASQTGLLPDGPTASRSSGFAAAIPSRELSMLMADVRASMRSDSVVDKDCALLAVERALAGEAEGRDRQGSVHEHAADLSATPEATPHQSPSPTTETNPPMSLEEARAVLDAVGARTNPQTHASLLRGHAIAMPAGPERDALTSKSARIEAALRTLHAAGEVRHDQ